MTAALLRSAPAAADLKTDHQYRVLEGRALPYWTPTNVGWFIETWASGALDASTVNSRASLPLLLFHDNRRWPIGHSVAWRSQPDGLHGTWALNDTPDAQQAARLIDGGDLAGLSVGFQPIRSDWTYARDFNPDLGPDHMDQVLRLAGRLLEVSLTPTPAFAGAGVTSVRSRSVPASAAGPHPTPRPAPRTLADWTVEAVRLHYQRA